MKYNRIKEVLASRGIKQAWLAEKLGKTQRMVGSYVSNEVQPSIPVLFQIAALLQVNPGDLLTDLTTITPVKTTLVMQNEKKQLLQQQILKLDEVLQVLRDNFDTTTEIPDEYSFLAIAKEKLEELAER